MTKRKRNSGSLKQMTPMDSEKHTSSMNLDDLAGESSETNGDSSFPLPIVQKSSLLAESLKELPAEKPSPQPIEVVAGSNQFASDKERNTAPVATLVLPAYEPRLAIATGDNTILSLEERVRRLETELARLQDTRTLESRVAAQVQEKLTHDLGSVAGAPPSAGLVEISKRLLGMNRPLPPRVLSPRPEGASHGWLVFELLAEVRAILRMYVDPRYRMTWIGRFLPLVLLIGFVFSDYVISIGLPVVGSMLLNIPFFGFFLKSFVQILFGFVLFKVLGLEARRYRQTSPDLPSSLKL